MGRPKKIIVQSQRIKTFEEVLPEIIILVNKHRHKWHLTSVPSVSWEDVTQILLNHLYIKFHLFDQSRSLGAWVNQVCHNRLINVLRDHYSGFARPCLRCPHHQGDNLCSLYGEVTEKCDLYLAWAKGKRAKYNINIPLPMENHINECQSIKSENIDIEKTGLLLHAKMKTVLKPLEYLIYKELFINHKSEEEVGKMLKLKSREPGRNPGYARVNQIKKLIMIQVRKVLQDGDVEIIGDNNV